VIDNPERRNAMNSAMYHEVPPAVEQIMGNKVIRCVIVRGAGSMAFGAGSDINEFPSRRTGDEAGRFDSAEHRAWRAIAAMPMPVIASIHGACIGGGLAIALHTDLRIASDDAVFAAPPARLGLAYPPPAVKRLVQLIGPSTAKLLLFSARSVTAEEALRIGLVDEIVDKDQLDSHTQRLAGQIADLSPLSIRAAKLAVDSIGAPHLRDRTKAAVSLCYGSSDFREGVTAFLDKRRPSFQGR